jgi:hypothetical protein
VTAELGRREPEARSFYYRCATQWDGGECARKKVHRAGDTEHRVWAFVRGLFGNAQRLGGGLERMIEMERAAPAETRTGKRGNGAPSSPRRTASAAATSTSLPKG